MSTNPDNLRGQIFPRPLIPRAEPEADPEPEAEEGLEADQAPDIPSVMERVSGIPEVMDAPVISPDFGRGTFTVTYPDGTVQRYPLAYGIDPERGCFVDADGNPVGTLAEPLVDGQVVQRVPLSGGAVTHEQVARSIEIDQAAEGVWEPERNDVVDGDAYIDAELARGEPIPPADTTRQVTEDDGVEIHEYGNRSSGAGGLAGSDAGELIDMVCAQGTFFHDPDGHGYVDITIADSIISDHRVTHRLRSAGFRSWLSYEFYKARRKPAKKAAMNNAIEAMEAKARYESPKRSVFVRLGHHGETTYLDMGDDTWRVIEIDAAGWRIVKDAPVRFVRPLGFLPLPEPVRAGALLDDLRQFINVADEDWVTVASWLINLLRPNGAQAILMLIGQQGSGKSFTSKVLRRMVDPNRTTLGAGPRNEQDLMLAALDQWVVGLDNMSGLAPWLPDGLCRIATGADFRARKLYSDTEQVVFSATRPQLINGIGEVSARSDLLDRSFIVELPTIVDWVDEEDLWSGFAESQPRLLAALLDAAVTARQNRRNVVSKGMRLASFTREAMAAAPALGLEPEEVRTHLVATRDQVALRAMEADPVALPLVGFIEAHKTWTGTSSELLAILADRLPGRPPRGWPATAKDMGTKLSELAPNLVRHGVEFRPATSHRHGRRHTLVWTGDSGDTGDGA